MSPTRRRTIRTQTTLVASSVVGLALIVAAYGLIGIVRHRLIEGERTAAGVRADDIVALATTGTLPNPLSYPGEETGATQVVKADGRVVTATSNLIEDDEDDEKSGTEPPISDLRPEAGRSASQIVPSLPFDDEHRFVVVATAAEVDDQPITVLAAASLEATDETITALARSLLLGVPLLILLVATTTRFLVGRALRPVGAITDKVADITQADLHRRVPEPGSNDEIDHLAITMNQMLGRLESSSARQRRFVADASHEMRSPLASSRTVLEVASQHGGSADVLRAAIDDALIDHARLESLVSDLLVLARLDGSEAAVRSTAVDIAVLAQDVVGRRTESNIELVAPEPTSAMAERSQMERVLTNLLDNASRHRKSATRVTLNSDATSIQLMVEDDGPGVPEADRDRVFERFTRLDEARTADQGTGLGLAIVKEVVTELGGTVRIRNSRLGGAAIQISLDRAPSRP